MYAIQPNIISAAKYNTISQWIKRFIVQGYKDLQNNWTKFSKENTKLNAH